MKQKLLEKLKETLTKEHLTAMFKSICEFIFNPPLLLCFGIGWLITNGWSYITFCLGIFFDIPVMTGIASAYMAFLWVPFTPEKIITVIIAIALLKRFFPNDEKTLKKLESLYVTYKTKNDSAKDNAKETFHENVQDTIDNIVNKKASQE